MPITEIRKIIRHWLDTLEDPAIRSMTFNDIDDLCGHSFPEDMKAILKSIERTTQKG